jgi:hypothetical protein
MKITNEDMMMASLNEKELSSVTFIHDYIQLNFDGPVINIYASSSIYKNDIRMDSQEFGYSYLLRKLIGKKIIGVKEVIDSNLTMTFDDLSHLQISLKPDDRSSVEAAMFQGGIGKGWVVW